MPVFFNKFIKHLPLVFRSYHVYLNLLVLCMVLFLASGSQVARSRVVAQNMPMGNQQEVIIVAKKAADVAKVEEIEGVVKGVAAPSVDVATKNSEDIAEKTNSESSNSDQKALCRDIADDWKMIPDPAHEGQYIICNTTSEQMTSASELNAAQNSYRTKHGLGALNINSELCKIAADRAVEVAKNFSHDGFRGAVEGSGVGKNSYGENIASGPLSGVHFVEWSWDKSPGHRENMLGDWTDGCGGVHDKYAVFLFAK